MYYYISNILCLSKNDIFIPPLKDLVRQSRCFMEHFERKYFLIYENVEGDGAAMSKASIYNTINTNPAEV